MSTTGELSRATKDGLNTLLVMARKADAHDRIAAEYAALVAAARDLVACESYVNWRKHVPAGVRALGVSIEVAALDRLRDALPPETTREI